MDSESRFVEWIGSYNYGAYNWLMLKSCDYNDKSDCGVWRIADDSDYDDEEDENNS